MSALAAEPVRSPPSLTFRRLLVPYDDSPPARAALDVAIAFARTGTEIYVVNVIDEVRMLAEATAGGYCTDAKLMLDAFDAEMRAMLEGARVHAHDAAVEIVTDVVHGIPIDTIAEMVAACRCDGIVMGTHAHSDVPRMFLGSITEGVLRRADVPVLTVRVGCAGQRVVIERILGAVDGSNASAAALVVAERLRAERHAELVRFTAPIEVNAGRAIVAAARSDRADLVVIGTHGRKGLDRLVLGSVAAYVVRNSEAPVLVVRCV